MTPQEKENYLSDLDFLSVDISEMAIVFSTDDAKTQGFIVIKVKENTRAFEPIEFCERFFIAQARKADAAKFKNGKSDLNKQAKIFVKFRTNITQVIERFRRYAVDYPYLRKYDFDSFLRQAETAINESKLNIEIKLLNSQVKTNESIVETNRISKITNIYIAIFTFIAAEYYCYEFLRDYISDSNTHKRAVVNFAIAFLLILGIAGYRQINRANQQQ